MWNLRLKEITEHAQVTQMWDPDVTQAFQTPRPMIFLCTTLSLVPLASFTVLSVFHEFLYFHLPLRC